MRIIFKKVTQMKKYRKLRVKTKSKKQRTKKKHIQKGIKQL